MAGYGRSGSTLLCAVLGGAENAVPVGELKIIFANYAAGKMCSCEKTLDKCDFWKSVVEEFLVRNPDVTLGEANRVTEQIEGFKNWFSLRYRNSLIEKKYQEIWRSIIEIVCEKSNCSLIIDASKSSSIACNRVRALSKIMYVEHIHLVRDPRSVMASTLSAQERRLKKHGIKPVPLRGLRTLLSWAMTNFYINVMNLLGLQKVMHRISYEDLTANPMDSLLKLGEETGINVSSILQKIELSEPFAARHIFSGDLQRMKGEYRIIDSPLKWPTSLNLFQRLISWCTYPLARTYGFFKIS